MDPLYIKVLHLLGAFCLFAGFGGLFAIGENRTNINTIVAALHGTGLLLLFLSGFALQGFMKLGFPMWLIAKIVLWLVMVGLFVFTKRKKISTTAGVFGALILGVVVAYLCLLKPF